MRRAEVSVKAKETSEKKSRIYWHLLNAAGCTGKGFEREMGDDYIRLGCKKQWYAAYIIHRGYDTV